LGVARLKLLRHLTVLCLAAGFSAFWYNPKFIYLTIVSSQGQLIWRTFSNILPVSFFLVPLLGVFGFLLFENRAHLQALFISFFLTVGFGLLVAGLGFSTVSSSRFEPAFGISLAFLLGVGITLFLDYFKDSESLGRIEIIASYRNLLMRGMIAAIFLFFLFLFVSYGRSLFPSEERVLGFLIPEHGIGLWEIRERTSQGETLVGYAISVLTGAGVGILRLKLRGA